MTSNPPALTLLTIERLLSIKAAILAEPERYDQCVWAPVGKQITDKFAETDPMCKSACCLFGWAIVLGGIPITEVDGIAFDEREVYVKAAEWLGIEHNPSNRSHERGMPATAADRLYHQALWPPQFGHGLVAKASARAAAYRIDHFIFTNGAE